MINIILVLLVASSVTAIPAAWKSNSWRRWLFASVMSFFVVIAPLIVFVLSAFMEPEWKGACHFGWLDCFIVGKLALTPLVLWGVAALYRTDVMRKIEPLKTWVVLGIFSGAIVSTVCLIFGLYCLEFSRMMIVPAYVSIWYFGRAIQLIKKSDLKFWSYLWTMQGSLPLWFLSWFWSLKMYQDLPDKAPDNCFVATAASHGHASLVGPFFETEHRGQRLRANQQLITLWQFEKRWQQRFPNGHRSFRRFYNYFGRNVASQIRSPWLADVTFLALKPVEWLAKICLRNN